METSVDSFSVFPRLPREIQDEIFDQAITNRECLGQIQTLVWFKDKLTVNLDPNDPSGYNSPEASLWLTCQQAQDVIERHWNTATHVQSGSKHHCTMEVRSPGTQQPAKIMVHPEKDLFLVKFPGRLQSLFYLRSMNLQLKEALPTTIAPRLALEYSVEWSYDLTELEFSEHRFQPNSLTAEGNQVGRLVQAALNFGRRDFLYIIDDNLVPRARVPEVEAIRKGVLCKGAGCRYVYVDSHDIGRTWKAKDGNNDDTAPKFLDDLYEYIFETFWVGREWEDFQRSGAYQSIAVLARLPDTHFQVRPKKKVPVEWFGVTKFAANIRKH